MLANNPYCKECGHRKSSHYKNTHSRKTTGTCRMWNCICYTIYDLVDYKW